MKKLLILICLMFPLMAQSVNDSREAKEEMRKERMEQHQQMQEKMWKQQNHGKQAEIDKMMMRMKMHDRKMVNQHKHHLNKFNNKNHTHQIHSEKKRRIIGGIVIFSLGYIVGADDNHRGKRHHNKGKDFKGDR